MSIFYKKPECAGRRTQVLTFQINSPKKSVYLSQTKLLKVCFFVVTAVDKKCFVVVYSTENRFAKE